MIAKNEESFLEKSLSSVRDLVDEIIIIDTGSTDKTKEIAKRFTDKIFDFTWCDDFSAARNESLKHATGDWILVLDADETVSAKDHLIIKKLLNDDADAFMVTQRTYTDNQIFLKFVSSQNDNYAESQQYPGWTPAKIVRLFRNAQGFFFSDRVHESILPSIMAKNGIIKEVSFPIHHFSALKDQTVAKRKADLYKKLGELKLGEDPTDVSAKYEAARRLLMERDYAEAEKLLEAVKIINPQYAPIYPLLIYIYAEKGNLIKAEEAFSLARLHGSDLRSAVLNLAIAYEKSKMPDKAIKLVYDFGFASTDFVPLLYLVGKCFYILNNYQQAAKYLAEVVEKDKHNLNAQTMLIDSFLRTECYPAAQAALKHALALSHPQSAEFEKLLSKVESRCSQDK